MIKLFERIFWHNNTTPAINEDNLNAMSKAIDDIDNRVIELGADVLEKVPSIENYLEQAEELVEDVREMTTHPPYIGENGNWYVWNTNTRTYEDSHVDASITVSIEDVTMLPYIDTPYVTNSGTNTDPIFHLFIPRAATISSVEKTHVSGQVDTYTMTLQDGSQFNFTVTNGNGSGDMKAVDYDPNDNVVNNGGIEGYFNYRIQKDLVTGLNHSVGVQPTEYPIHVEGVDSTIGASSCAAHVEGGENTVGANTKFVHVEGSQNHVLGNWAHAEGCRTTAYSLAHAEGLQSYAVMWAHAEGVATSALDNTSHAEGSYTRASGFAAHAEGATTCATDDNSHAEGLSTTASGQQSHSEGKQTLASGVNSHSEGVETSATGTNSHSEGYRTLADGYYSHSGGAKSSATEYCSFVHGDACKARTPYSVVFGYMGEAKQYTASEMNHNKNRMLVLGGGYSSHGTDFTYNDINVESSQDEGNDAEDNGNIFSVDERGNMFLRGCPYLVKGVLNNRLIANGDYYVLEDGAAYILYTNTRMTNNGTWRGAQAYYICAPFAPQAAGTGATTTALAVAQHHQFSNIGTAGLTLKKDTVQYTDDAGHTAYHARIGIGSCVANCTVRYTLIKVIGSEADFATRY